MSGLTGFIGGAVAAGVVAAPLLLGVWRRRSRKERDAEKRAHRAEKMAYAGQLAGALIHEIKNPLNTLSMNLQLLAEDWQDGESQKERRALKRLKRLQTETERLNAILNDFMDFVREPKLQLHPCNPNDVVDEVVMFLRPELDLNDIELRCSYGTVPACRLDSNRFKQALLNLVLNAQEAVAGRPAREIMIRTSTEDEQARIEVTDTGKGIPAEDMERIFEAFYSTRKGGTGLGLPTTRRIIEAHGGTLSVHSEVDRGTSFIIRIPIQSGESDTRAERVEKDHG